MLAFEPAIGVCGMRWSEAGVTEVLLAPRRSSTDQRRDAPDAVRRATTGIMALLEGKRVDLRDIVLDERPLDDFQRRVYAATREVGPGQTASYGEIARALGAPGAARGVGAALGSNPSPLIVPCHRVLAADGSLHGFSAPGGITTKRRLLEIEGAPGFTQGALFA